METHTEPREANRVEPEEVHDPTRQVPKIRKRATIANQNQTRRGRPAKLLRVSKENEIARHHLIQGVNAKLRAATAKTSQQNIWTIERSVSNCSCKRQIQTLARGAKFIRP